MAARSRPVMQAATAIAMLAEVQLVTHPASAPVAAAMARLAARCSSAISTDCGRMPAMARTTSGDTGLAPNTVSVPEMLISGVSPSSPITSSHGIARPLLVVIPAKAGIHLADAELVEEWIPAFAGMTTEWYVPAPCENLSDKITFVEPSPRHRTGPSPMKITRIEALH